MPIYQRWLHDISKAKIKRFSKKVPLRSQPLKQTLLQFQFPKLHFYFRILAHCVYDDSYLYLGSWLCEDNFSVGWRFAGFKEISLFSNRFPVDRDMLALVVLQRSKPLASADNCSKLRRSHCVLGFSAAKNRNSICNFGSIFDTLGTVIDWWSKSPIIAGDGQILVH